MRNYKSKTVEVKELESITCDKCKNDYTNIMEIQEFLSINLTGGYASVFGDGATIEMDICQYCLKEIHDDIFKE